MAMDDIPMELVPNICAGGGGERKSAENRTNSRLLHLNRRQFARHLPVGELATG